MSQTWATLKRMSVGFSVAYFQVPWTTKSGGLEVMGVEAACVPFAFGSLVLPLMHAT